MSFATGARSWAAAQGAAAAKCPEHWGWVCELSAPSEDPSSGKEPEPHPQHQEGEEGGVGGTFSCSFLSSIKVLKCDSDNGLWSPTCERAQRISVDYEALLKEHEDVKKKLDASKARNKYLSTEIKTLKSQISDLLVKSKHDDELVDALLVSQFGIFLLF